MSPFVASNVRIIDFPENERLAELVCAGGRREGKGLGGEHDKKEGDLCQKGRRTKQLVTVT